MVYHYFKKTSLPFHFKGFKKNFSTFNMWTGELVVWFFLCHEKINILFFSKKEYLLTFTKTSKSTLHSKIDVHRLYVIFDDPHLAERLGFWKSSCSKANEKVFNCFGKKLHLIGCLRSKSEVPLLILWVYDVIN